MLRESLAMAIEALEKQIPKAPIMKPYYEDMPDEEYLCCPTCRDILTELNPPGTDENYMEISQKSMESFLKKHPESIIKMLDECPTAKELVFNRLKKFGGVKWYRYLDMSNQVIRWVNDNLEGMEDGS